MKSVYGPFIMSFIKDIMFLDNGYNHHIVFSGTLIMRTYIFWVFFDIRSLSCVCVFCQTETLIFKFKLISSLMDAQLTVDN